MRNPNGYGGISKLSGNRRNPYRVRITDGWEYNEETMRQRQVYKTLGYYPTRKDAMLALANYNADPYDLDVQKITFGDVYNKWMDSNREKFSTTLQGQYNSAYKKLYMLHNLKMRDIKKMQLQAALDANHDMSKIYLERMRGVIRHIYRYCLDYEILDKDVSVSLKLNSTAKDRAIHTSYTADEIQKLWDNVGTAVPLRLTKYNSIDVYPADIILITIYTGMRTGEILKLRRADFHLEDSYVIGGIKTAAGKNRVIPLHDDIMPLVKARLERTDDYFVPYKNNLPPNLDQFRNFMFDPLVKPLGMLHLPHDGRHTFITNADRFIDDKNMIKKIVGHTVTDLTAGTYTHTTPADLLAAVNKINFLKK